MRHYGKRFQGDLIVHNVSGPVRRSIQVDMGWREGDERRSQCNDEKGPMAINDIVYHQCFGCIGCEIMMPQRCISTGIIKPSEHMFHLQSDQ